MSLYSVTLSGFSRGKQAKKMKTTKFGAVWRVLTKLNRGATGNVFGKPGYSGAIEAWKKMLIYDSLMLTWLLLPKYYKKFCHVIYIILFFISLIRLLIKSRVQEIFWTKFFPPIPTWASKRNFRCVDYRNTSYWSHCSSLQHNTKAKRPIEEQIDETSSRIKKKLTRKKSWE